MPIAHQTFALYCIYSLIASAVYQCQCLINHMHGNSMLPTDMMAPHLIIPILYF